MTDERDDEDAKLILSRRQLLVAGAISGVTLATAGASAQSTPCLAPPRPPLTFSQAPGRRNTPRDRIPAVIRNQLSDRMIYAAGGGMTSTPWRILLSLHRTLTAAEGNQPGGASYGTLPITWSTRLLEPEARDLVTLADRAWREQRSPNQHPTADYDEVLAMRDGDEHFFAQGFGPLRGGAVEELIARLRAAANASRPAR